MFNQTWQALVVFQQIPDSKIQRGQALADDMLWEIKNGSKQNSLHIFAANIN